MSTSFNSTSFFLSKWAEDKPEKKPRLRRIELDIVEDPSVREVCQGGNCSLFYDSDEQDYITAGACQRQSFCTETRILKDGLFVKTGNVSSTNKCVNYDHQLKMWAE